MPCVYDNHYHYLKSSIEESIAYVNGNLKFKFEENYFDNSQTLEYQIKDLNTNNATPVSGTLTKLVEVDFYSINILGGGLNLVSGRTYLLTVTNEKGIKSYLKFKVA